MTHSVEFFFKRRKKIIFSKPVVLKKQFEYLRMAISRGHLSGDHEFTQACNLWLEQTTKAKKVLLTSSGTHALEMAALLLDIKTGDEVIMPSYTFPSTANAFILRGARVVFVDIRPDTMNLDESLIEPAITKKTRAIVPVHYAGVGCEMNAIKKLAKRYKLAVVEDAAQGLMASYRRAHLGTLGDLGAFSFHETKNYTGGEAGAILINDEKFMERAEIIREKGTNRAQFFRGEIDKYTWRDIGSSFLPSDLNAAFLLAQLEIAEKINRKRLRLWNHYYKNLRSLEAKGYIVLTKIPAHCKHNAHIFFIKVRDLAERGRILSYLHARKIFAYFHYVPLHSSPAGQKYGRFSGVDRFTTKESERLVRLPLYYDMVEEDAAAVCDAVEKFYQ